MKDASTSATIRVLFFGKLKEIVGLAEDDRLAGGELTVEELFAEYARRVPQLAKFRSSVVASRNQEFTAWDTKVGAGDEIAFLPPVSGG